MHGVHDVKMFDLHNATLAYLIHSTAFIVQRSMSSSRCTVHAHSGTGGCTGAAVDYWAELHPQAVLTLVCWTCSLVHASIYLRSAGM